MQFKVNFTKNITVIYDLADHEVATHWASLISARTPNECCKINHYSGHHDPVMMETFIARLYDLVDIINVHAPRPIQKVQFTKENFYNALNTMHVHFPELEQDPKYGHISKHLSEYNDIIHWLEPALIDHYNGVVDHRRFSIKLDFNKLNNPKYTIPHSAFNLFTGYFGFGQLMLHYVHVGRHSWELFFANDLVCPKDQFVPQSLYNASVRLHFYGNPFDDPVNKLMFDVRWQNFYNRRGGKEFFGYDITDPAIRLGYCKIGQVSSIIVDGSEIPLPKTPDEISIFRDKLVTTKILDWEIKGA